MKEKIYDEQINPLIAQIITICKEHKIAMLADFALDGDLKCTTALLDDSYAPTKNQLRAHELLRPNAPVFAMAETIETLPDGTKKITLQRIS